MNTIRLLIFFAVCCWLGILGLLLIAYRAIKKDLKDDGFEYLPHDGGFTLIKRRRAA